MTDGGRRCQNPTFGLAVWGPLIPASDCKSCLYTLSAIQGVGGLILWWLPRKKMLPNQSIWKHRLTRMANMAVGTYLMGSAGLEFVRLQLPTDPWADDAANARKRALEKGEKVSQWFGPSGYQPVEFSEWKRRVDQSLQSAEQNVNITAILTNKDMQQQIRKKRNEGVQNIHDNIKQKNREIADNLLNELRNNVKFPVAEEYQEDEEQYRKDNEAILRDLTTDDLEWDVLEPWETLSEETDIVVRFMPHSRAFSNEVDSPPFERTSHHASINENSIPTTTTSSTPSAPASDV